MNSPEMIDQYLAAGDALAAKGHKSDGCTFVQWFVRRWAPKVTRACRSHDFGYRKLIPVADTQRRNDLLFRDAIAHLGHPVLSRVMYAAIAFRTRLGVGPSEAAIALAFIGFLSFILWHAATK